MSEALIASLQGRIDELTRQNAALAAEAKDRRIKGKKALADLDAATKERDALLVERDAWKGKAEAAPGEKDKRIGDLEGQVRTRDHRDAFAGIREVKAKVKDELGVESEKTFTLNPGVPIEDVWGKAGYRAEGETPDAATVAGHLGKAYAAAPWLFGAKVETTEGDPRGSTRPALHTELPAGRGGTDHDGSRFTVRRSDLANADWMQRNQARFSEASAAGNVVLID